MRTTNESVFPALHSVNDRHEEDFMTIQMIAGKLQQTAEWVESECRRRSPNPIPFHNVGNHRLFLLSEVHAWVMKGSPHTGRTQEFKRGGGIDCSTLLTTSEAAKRLYISKKTLLKYCRQHRIGYHRYNGGFRFRLSDIEQFLSRTYVSATTRKAA